MFLFSSRTKFSLRTEFFWKVSYSLLISLILLVRIRISSTYLRYIEGFFMLLKILFSRSDIWKLPKIGPRNLFTNVPVNETIDIIINNIHNNPSLPPLKINPNILRKLLLTCTTEVPFYDHLGNIYVQTDGVSMGSVLGPLRFERDHVLYLISSPPPLFSLNCMCSQVTLQASQTVTDFATDLAQSISFVCSDIIWV